MSKHKATAVILAGGASRRMGQDKSLMEINGKPMIQSIYDQLEPHFDEIIISSDFKEKYAFLNTKIVPDEKADCGPLMGLMSCLKESSSERNFLIACDIPLIDMEFVAGMVKEAENYDIVIPMTEEDKFEPTFAVYSKSVLNSVQELLESGRRRIAPLFNMVNTHYVEMDSNIWYQNLNTLDEYKAFISEDL